MEKSPEIEARIKVMRTKDNETKKSKRKDQSTDPKMKKNYEKG